MSVLGSRRHQRLNLMLGQIFAGSQVRIFGPQRHDCSFFDGWRDQRETGFSHINSAKPWGTVATKALLRTVSSGASRSVDTKVASGWATPPPRRTGRGSFARAHVCQKYLGPKK